ncbi:MAG: patatin-like phospholipase family protein [Marinilabilia sp.]
MIKIRIFISLLLLGTLISVRGQRYEQPKIGLVLSGGGAKGLAHIGVMKVLEEEGLVPDYITGTSMGSIIGGLYSIGYSPAELDSIVRDVSWGRLLSDDIPLSAVSPHEKDEYNRYQAEFTLTRKGVKIPSGLIRGQQINNLLSGLSWHMADVQNFDDLPIPFRCVAADLKSRQEYVFEEGDLASAMRASMSIPTVFSPVRKDSMLLVDGGVLNNFPVELCREMGADIIIGVNVGFKDEPEEEDMESFTEILMAAATISGNISYQQAIEQTNLLISPDLSDYSTGSFFDAGKIIQIGEEAAREKLGMIRSVMDSAGIRPRQPLSIDKSINKEIHVSQIRINGLKNLNDRILLGNLGIQPGDTITTTMIDDGLRRAMGSRHFENINYQLEPMNSGHLLELNVEESPIAKIKFALHYDNEYKAGLMTNVTARNFVGRSSRTSLTIDISETPRFGFSQINFLGEKHVNAAKFEVDHENNNLPIYLDNGSKYGTFKHEYTDLRGGFMTTLGTRWKLDFYAKYAKSTLQNKSGFSDIFYAGVEQFGNTFLSSAFDFTYSSIDSRYLPKKGSHLELNYDLSLDIREEYDGTQEGQELVSDLTHIPHSNYFSLSGKYRKYFSVNRHFTTGLRLSGHFTSQSPPFLGLTFIGGLPFNNRSNEVPFIGYSFREKLAEDFALGEINLRYQLLKQIHINAMGGMLLSNINLPDVIEPIGLDKTERVLGYGVTIAYQSFLGPLQVGLGSNDTDNRLRWYFNFGFNF